MVVVALVAILATIAIPMFASEGRKAKAETEVAPLFAELQIREQQYKVDNNVYLAAAACPSAPSTTPQDVTPCRASGTPWDVLRVRLPRTTVFCSYAVVVGTTTGTNNPQGFVFASPNMPWYYIVATCDMDGNSTPSTYFSSSVDSAIQKLSEGE